MKATFRILDTGETFTADNLRHLCSPMQDLRDSVPAQFRSQMDWAHFFAARVAEPEIPDGYRHAIAAMAVPASVKPSTRYATGHTGSPDGYARHLAGVPRPNTPAPIDPFDGYKRAIALRKDS